MKRPRFSTRAAVNMCDFDRMVNRTRYGHPWLVRWIKIKWVSSYLWRDCEAKAMRRKP